MGPAFTQNCCSSPPANRNDGQHGRPVIAIRPRPAGLRLLLIGRQFSQPLVAVSLLVLVATLVRELFTGSWGPGAFSLLLIPIFLVLSLGYLALYYRNVSFSVANGQLVRTGPLGGKKSVPIASIERFVGLRTAARYGNVFQVLVLGKGDRCLMIIGRGDEYSYSEIEKLAAFTGRTLTDGGAVDLREFADRYPGAVSGFGSFVIAAWSRLRLIQATVVVAIVVGFAVWVAVTTSTGR